MGDEPVNPRLDRVNRRRRRIEGRTRFVIAALAAALCGLTACSDVRPVSSSTSTNLQGSPGTANDVTTGGHGNDIRRR